MASQLCPPLILHVPREARAVGELYYQGQNGMKTVPWGPREEQLSRLVYPCWRNPRSLSLLKPPPGAVQGQTLSLEMQIHLRVVPATSVVSQIVTFWWAPLCSSQRQGLDLGP